MCEKTAAKVSAPCIVSRIPRERALDRRHFIIFCLLQSPFLFSAVRQLPTARCLLLLVMRLRHALVRND